MSASESRPTASAVRVAYVQLAPAFCDREETRRRLAPLLAESAEADLVVLPELCNSGYRFETRQEAWDSSESAEDGAFTAFLQQQCATHGFDAVAGLNERADDRLYNSAVLVGAEGWIGSYRKLHLFDREKEFFEPGDLGIPVFERNGVKLAMLVCFDWAFPEAWRVAALRGADLVCHPSNLVLTGFAQQAVPVHSITNRIYVVTANRVGSERDLTFTGNSLITDPRGQVLSRGHHSEACLGIVDLDPARARDKRITPNNDVLADRRPREYGPICGPPPPPAVGD